MANTGFKVPTAATSTSSAPYSNDTWVNPTNIYSDNAAYAQITALTFDLPDYSYLLKASGFDFSAVPSGATIDGVIVRIQAKSGTGADATLVHAKLLDTSGNPTGSNLADSWYPGTTDADHDLGSSTNLWGCALTQSWVTNSNFGVAIAFQADAANAKIYVDIISIDVYYTAATGKGKVNIAGTWKTVNTVSVNIGGVWKTVDSIKVNVGGVWKSLT